MAAEEGFEDPEIARIAQRLHQTWDDTHNWVQVARVAALIRDAREKAIVDRVEHYLEDLIETTGVENPTLTVRDVRAQLFEVPQ
jgi:adenosyl cobinamide kinase/adenosyl cobinamide phosphate guanylyltransferase